MTIKKQTSYILPEVDNKIFTAEDLFTYSDTKITAAQLRKMTPNEIDDIWYHEALETTRFHICSRCNKIHSRTYEGCETEKSEFFKFFKTPKTVWLETV